MFEKPTAYIHYHPVLYIRQRHIIYIEKYIFQEIANHQNQTEHFQLLKLRTVSDESIG